MKAGRENPLVPRAECSSRYLDFYPASRASFDPPRKIGRIERSSARRVLDFMKNSKLFRTGYRHLPLPDSAAIQNFFKETIHVDTLIRQ